MYVTGGNITNRSRIILMALLISLMTSLGAFGAWSTDSLGIFGNANMDNTIDEEDIEYVKGVIKGTDAATNLSDANFDGMIDDKDLARIKEIIDDVETEITILDSANRSITIKKPVSRAIPVNANILETMRSIKAKDMVIATEAGFTGREEIIFSEFKDLPKVGVGHSSSLDVEKIIELKPDLVLMYPSQTKKKEIIEPLNLAGIAVVGFDCYNPATYADEIKKLSYIFKRKDGQEFLEFYENYMDSIKRKTSDLSENEMPKVYVEASQKGPYNSFGSESGYHEKISIAGGVNLFGDVSSSAMTVDPEEVLTRNPDLILITSTEGGYNRSDARGLMDARNNILSRSEFSDITAVKDKEVYAMEERIIGGVRNFIGIGYLAKWLHPDLFEDLDPHAIHQEYLTRFQQIDFNLNENGVFVYPSSNDN